MLKSVIIYNQLNVIKLLSRKTSIFLSRAQINIIIEWNTFKWCEMSVEIQINGNAVFICVTMKTRISSLWYDIKDQNYNWCRSIIFIQLFKLCNLSNIIMSI